MKTADGRVQNPEGRMPVIDNIVVYGSGMKPVNNRPTIGALCDPVIIAGDDPLMIKFVVNDEETAPENLIITAVSSNRLLLSDGDISIEGTGSVRALFLNSTASEGGKAQITLTVSDGEKFASETFTVTILKEEDPCP